MSAEIEALESTLLRANSGMAAKVALRGYTPILDKGKFRDGQDAGIGAKEQTE